MRGFVKLALVSLAPPTPKGEERWAAKWTPDGKSITEERVQEEEGVEHGAWWVAWLAA